MMCIVLICSSNQSNSSITDHSTHTSTILYRFIQMCRSVIITHPLQYIQHYHHLFNTDPLSPLQNMIEVPTPLEENLPGVMEELLKDEERGERIASNSWREFREGYISPAAK